MVSLEKASGLQLNWRANRQKLAELNGEEIFGHVVYMHVCGTEGRLPSVRGYEGSVSEISVASIAHGDRAAQRAGIGYRHLCDAGGKEMANGVKGRNAEKARRHGDMKKAPYEKPIWTYSNGAKASAIGKMWDAAAAKMQAGIGNTCVCAIAQ
jgi:hypothetical protein